MYGGINDAWMGNYFPQVRWNLDVSPRGNSRRTPGALPLAEGGRGRPVHRWYWDSDNAGSERITCYILTLRKVYAQRLICMPPHVPYLVKSLSSHHT